MNKVEAIPLFKQNSLQDYKEDEIISKVKKIISPFAGIHQELITKTPETITIPTTLHVHQISDKTMVNELSKINAKLETTPLDHEIFVICKRPRTYPAWVHGVVYFLYGIISFISWRNYIKPLLYAYSLEE